MRVFVCVSTMPMESLFKFVTYSRRPSGENAIPCGSSPIAMTLTSPDRRFTADKVPVSVLVVYAHTRSPNAA